MNIEQLRNVIPAEEAEKIVQIFSGEALFIGDFTKELKSLGYSDSQIKKIASIVRSGVIYDSEIGGNRIERDTF